MERELETNKNNIKVENPSKLLEYEGLNEDLDLDW